MPRPSVAALKVNRANLHFPVTLNVAAALALAVTSLLLISQSRQLARQNALATRVTRNRQALANLLNESVQYSQKNPAIRPLLASAGISVNTAAAPTNPVPPRAPSPARPR